MSAAITFNTLKFSKKLIDAGVPLQQAEAQTEAQADIFAEVIENNFATKQDLKHEIQQVKHEFKQEIATTKNDMIKWTLGIVLTISTAQAAVILSVIKFFH